MNRVEPNRNVYVGHRYVPLLVGEWDKSIQYEGLSIVTFKGASYTSKKRTPAGIDIENEEYWVLTGNYNAQIEYYRQDVERYRDEVNGMGEYVDDEVEKLNIYVNDETASSRQYVDDNVNDLTRYVNDETASARQYVNDEVDKKVDGTVESLDLYVSNNGDDSNNGSVMSPFKTLSRTVEEIPDVIRKDHVVTINLNIGEWDETLDISNKTIQGQLIVKGTTENRENHKVFKVFGESVDGHFEISHITTTAKNGAGQSFLFRRCPSVYVDYVKAESNPEVEKGLSGVIGLLADYNSYVRVRNSDFSGKRYGIRCNYGSKVFSTDNTGSDNTFGIGSRWGGIMSIRGSQPEGDTNQSVQSGSQIISDSGAHVGLPNELYLVNAVRHRHDGNYFKKEYFINRINNSNIEVERGQAIRVLFKGNLHGPHYMKIKYGGQTAANGTTQYIEEIYTFMLQDNSFTNIKSTTVHYHLMDGDAIQVNHVGDRSFELLVDPLVALSGRWAIEIELSTFRPFTPPTLERAEVVDVPEV